MGFESISDRFDRDDDFRKSAQSQDPPRTRAFYEALDEETDVADVVVGAVLIPGASAPKLVTREMLKGMKEGSVLVDVAIDQGGCFETSHATTHEDPTYVVDDIIHYCVANMPGAVPLTSSHALNNATLSFGLALANKGLEALKAEKGRMSRQIGSYYESLTSC